jgi:tetratricopeptide (TPR) repeat protein
VRVALASSLRSAGELDRCRTTLLDAIDRLPPDAHARRVELTASCAEVEHWLGRREDAHRRLVRAAHELPESYSCEAAVLQLELMVAALYALDHEEALAAGQRALDAARRNDNTALIAAAGAALALGEASAGRIAAAREHREEVVERLERLTDTEIAARLEVLFYLAWAENYLERFDEAMEHSRRGIAIARATGQGRLLVPMMLVQGWPLEMTGRLPEAVEVCEEATEAARLSANPRYLFWALWELGLARGWSGDLEGALTALEQSAEIAGGLASGLMPAGSGEPGWSLGVALADTGQVERGISVMLDAAGGPELERVIPVERCFAWEDLALAELRRGDIAAADAYARRAEENAAVLGLAVPAACAGRSRAAVLLATGKPLEAPSLPKRPSSFSARRRSSRTCAIASRSSTSPPGSRSPAWSSANDGLLGDEGRRG